jgi:hypothetical protein
LSPWLSRFQIGGLERPENAWERLKTKDFCGSPVCFVCALGARCVRVHPRLHSDGKKRVTDRSAVNLLRR